MKASILLSALLIGFTGYTANAQSKKHKKSTSHSSTSHKKTTTHKKSAAHEREHEHVTTHKYVAAGKVNSDIFFKLDLKRDDKLADIYSRTITYKGDDFAEVVNRTSGTSTYTVVDEDALSPIFDCIDYYDGSKPSNGKFMTGINGKSSYNGKAFDNVSASGLLFNEMVWGNPPASVGEGETWAVNIAQAWELGGPGTQTVQVTAMDARNHTITLKREGSSEGFYDNDTKQINITTKNGKTVKANVNPGTSHWIGYTTFKNGLVVNDELMVTRPVTLTADGINFKAQQREYILLNAMPTENVPAMID